MFDFSHNFSIFSDWLVYNMKEGGIYICYICIYISPRIKKGRQADVPADSKRSGQPNKELTTENLKKCTKSVLMIEKENSHALAGNVRISKERVGFILIKYLSMNKLCSKWLPCLLALDQKTGASWLFRAYIIVRSWRYGWSKKLFIWVGSMWRAPSKALESIRVGFKGHHIIILGSAWFNIPSTILKREQWVLNITFVGFLGWKYKETIEFRSSQQLTVSQANIWFPTSTSHSQPSKEEKQLVEN